MTPKTEHRPVSEDERIDLEAWEPWSNLAVLFAINEDTPVT